MRTCFLSSYGMGVSENSWMTLMDRLLTLNNYCTNENEKERVKENMLKLIDIYYEALDAPKSGRKVSLYYSLVATNPPTFLVGTQKTNILL